MSMDEDTREACNIWETLPAVADRIIPEDGWPQATRLGVLTYLERHRGQHPQTWIDLIEPGLQALERDSTDRYQRAFSRLSSEQQDALLENIEAGRVQGWSISAHRFFVTLMTLITEGYYADPGNGGNRERKAWEMIGFRPDPVAGPVPPPVEVDPAICAFDDLDNHYDVVIVGAGAGGGVAAMVLAEAGLHVLLVERGSWLRYSEIAGDHLRNHRLSVYGHNTGPAVEGHPRTILDEAGRERVTAAFEGDYHNNAMTVGGGTRVYGAQAWRFHPDDFRMATRYGVPGDSTLCDWPIGYADLEPYYERAEWELGVAGDAEAHPGRGPRHRPYPMPALPATKEGQRLQQAAARLHWDVGPVPLLINSVARDGRPGCGRCGQCVGFACPTNSKNGSHNTVLLRALASGRCDLVTETMAERIATTDGRHATAVHVAQMVGGVIHRRQIRAEHVVVAAGAIESARLLLNSASVSEPQGVGNGTDQVGRNLQGHVYSGAYGLFEDPIQDGLGPGVSIATCRFAHGNADIIGGGMLANEFIRLPLVHWLRALPPHQKRWGAVGKEAMREGYVRTARIQGPIQEIPQGDSRVQISPTVKDQFGLPVALLSGKAHPESIKAASRLAEHAQEWLVAAGARQVWSTRIGQGLSGGQHQAGTLRMGTDPKTSVTDPSGRVHGYDNLWISDGSVHVTNGGVNPVLTILAMAFRTAEQITKSL